MGTALLAGRVRAGERAAFAEMYESYADRIYGFCIGLLRDRDEAADAMHDTFVLAAQRIGQLRDLDRLQPWLFAIARHVCYRRLRERARVTLVDTAPEELALDDGIADALSADEASSLVWDAANGLNDRDRAVLYLNTNQGLEGADLAAALGECHANPYSLLNRAKQQLERAVAVLLVARFGRRDCAPLAELLHDWDGALTPLLRKRIARHVEQCAACGETRTRTLRLAVFTAIPIMRPQRLEAMPQTRSPDDVLNIAERRGEPRERWRPDGFPPDHDRKRGRRRLLALLAAALVLLLALAVGEVTGAASGPSRQPPIARRPLTDAPRRQPVTKVLGTRVATSTASASTTTIARRITSGTTIRTRVLATVPTTPPPSPPMTLHRATPTTLPVAPTTVHATATTVARPPPTTITPQTVPLSVTTIAF